MNANELSIFNKSVLAIVGILVYNVVWFRMIVTSALMSGSDLGVLAAPFLVAVGVVVNATAVFKFVQYIKKQIIKKD